jgi:superfamily II DNA/RNA helicase
LKIELLSQKRGVPLSFEQYDLSPDLLSGLVDTRLEQPTPLQHEVIPQVLQGKHMLVKNEEEDKAAFLIPALQKLIANGEATGTRILILTPSIERAKAIDEMIWAMGYHAQVSSASLSMKGDRATQEQAILDGAPVIVANPGRLVDILEKTNTKFENLECVIIDEAHAMENFNLVGRVKSVFERIESTPQVLIFSGTLNSATKQLAEQALQNPELIGFQDLEEEQKAPVEAADIDPEVVQQKLAKASVKVVLNPEPKETEATTNGSESGQEETTAEDTSEEKTAEVVSDEEVVESVAKTVEEKLEAAEVEVVLEPDTEDTQEASDASNEVSEQEEKQATESTEEADSESEPKTVEPAKLDQAKVEEKLTKASVKVVLNPEPKEEQEAEESPKEKLKEASVEVVLPEDQEDEPTPVSKDLEQVYINVPPRMKISTLMSHLENSPKERIVIFTASKRTTDRLFRIILKKSWGVVSVHEGIDQQVYNDRFQKFVTGEMKVLLVGGISATDIELDKVTQVINYDVPSEVEEYKYRAELVGNKKAAQMVSLVSKMDREDIDRITKEVGYAPVEIKLPEEVLEKKKKKSSKPTEKKDNSKNDKYSKNRNRRGGKSSRNNKHRDNSSSKKSNKNHKQKRSKRDELALPRPSYDGLSGGREGREEPKGVFGWVKKLFK